MVRTPGQHAPEHVHTPSHSARRTTALAIALCLALSSGCAGWRTVSREEMVREVRGYRPSKIRLVYPDSTVEVRDPAIRADSLMGTVKRWGAMKPIAVSLADVDRAEVPGNLRKPARWFGVPVMALMAATIVLVLTTGGEDSGTNP